MELFAGKSTNERNKIIVAVVLGFVALVAMYIAFGSGIFSGSKAAVVTATPTPKPGAKQADTSAFDFPSKQERDLGYATTPVSYDPNAYGGGEPGRNVFAFYEPPVPCPTCPTPTPKPVLTPTPPPPPPPPMRLQYVTPQTVYAGSGTFRLEANGDKFDPSARLYFNQIELPTQFVSPQKLVANVPASLISSSLSAGVIAQTPDGKLYSDQVMISVQAPPKPGFQYIGMIARVRHNNDTGYFMEQGKQTPTGARLNDVVGGRFRLVSISSAEAIFEDVNLGFKHRVKLYDPPPGTTAGGTSPIRPGFQRNDGNYYQQYQNGEEIPGIPNNYPRVIVPQPQQNVQRPPGQKQDTKKDDDNDDDDGGGRP
ncbi:MAG TPA: hypothetical protein VGJ02_09480 [Pyrinomonadaceae bacterium]|jgi:hypothetical protein